MNSVESNNTTVGGDLPEWSPGRFWRPQEVIPNEPKDTENGALAFPQADSGNELELDLKINVSITACTTKSLFKEHSESRTSSFESELDTFSQATRKRRLVGNEIKPSTRDEKDHLFLIDNE